MKIVFTENAWEDYIGWQVNDKKVVKKINQLIRDIIRNPTEGIGKPEALKYDLSGYWSRRIDREHRIVYQFDEHHIYIFACRYHYD